MSRDQAIDYALGDAEPTVRIADTEGQREVVGVAVVNPAANASRPKTAQRSVYPAKIISADPRQAIPLADAAVVLRERDA